MEPVHITIRGNVPSKKNSKRIIRTSKRLFIVSSENYLQWAKDAAWELTGAPRIAGMVRVEVFMYPSTKVRSDLTNKAESIMDLLVDNGIIQDDNHFVVPEITLAFKGVDKKNPRAEVILYPLVG